MSIQIVPQGMGDSPRDRKSSAGTGRRLSSFRPGPFLFPCRSFQPHAVLGLPFHDREEMEGFEGEFLPHGLHWPLLVGV